MAEPEAGQVPIARIGRYRGNRGEVTLHAHFDLQRERLQDQEVEVRWPDGSVRRLRVERIRQQGDKTVCLFKGCRSISDAQELRHGEVFAPRSSLAPLDEDEYFAADLLGCDVVLKDGAPLGTVESLSESGGASVLTVRGRREHLIPLAKAIVTEVDLKKRRLTVDAPPGLLELNED
jgi:16S rRNA processing protein RimM